MEAEDWWIQQFITAVQDPYFIEKLLDMGQINDREVIFKIITELERHQIEKQEIWGGDKHSHNRDEKIQQKNYENWTRKK